MSTETLQKLYLELANVVPKGCLSSREVRLGRIIDQYEDVLIAVANACGDPVAKRLARDVLDEVKGQP